MASAHLWVEPSKKVPVEVLLIEIGDRQIIGIMPHSLSVWYSTGTYRIQNGRGETDSGSQRFALLNN